MTRAVLTDKAERETPAQKRMREAVARLTHYMVIYDKQHSYKDYQDRTFIEDVLYGLGIALEPIEYKYADGFDKFKKILREHLK